MNKYMKSVGLALVIGAASFGTAQAEGEWSGNVAIGTDYVWRGVTQSAGDWAVSGGFDYANGMFYAGTWASNVDFGDGTDTNLELDLYGGLASEFANGVTWDVGLVGYFYPDSSDSDLDFLEIYGGLGYEFENGLGIGGKLSYDPDNQNTYIEASAAYGFSDVFAADIGVGNYSFDGGSDYTSFNIGATFSFEGFDLDGRFWSNDIDTAGLGEAGEALLDDRFVLTLSRAL